MYAQLHIYDISVYTRAIPIRYVDLSPLPDLEERRARHAASVGLKLRFSSASHLADLVQATSLAGV